MIAVAARRSARRVDRGREGDRRISPGVRRDVRRRAVRRLRAAQAPRREAARGHGPRRCATPTALGFVGADERRLLTSVERPIVLVRETCRRAGSRKRSRPDNRMIGVMLPYSPLHHLLLADAGRPLVMTSGNSRTNRSRTTTTMRCGRLGGIADLFVSHDRDIADARATTRWSTVIAGGRRCCGASRGYVPRPVPLVARLRHAGARLRRAAEEHVLHRVGDQRVARSAHRRSRQPANLRVATRGASRDGALPRASTPQVVAHDLHPDYLSTAYARRRDRRDDGRRAASSRARGERDGRARHRRSRRSASRTTAPATAPTARCGAARFSSRRPLRSSGSRRSGRCRSSAATARSASRGGSRSRWSLDAFGGEVPLDRPAGLFGAVPIAESRGRRSAADTRGLASPRRAASDATSTRSARSFWAGRTRASKGRSRSSGIRSPTRV